MTTDEAMKRSDENYLGMGRFQGVDGHRLSRAPSRAAPTRFMPPIPTLCAAIEGAQIPAGAATTILSLATSVDAMELYAYGENIPIARSFNPELILLTTSFGSGPRETHRVWREFLRGTRGLVLWDDKREFVGEDGSSAATGGAQPRPISARSETALAPC